MTSIAEACFIQPDKLKAYQGTWTGATYNAGNPPVYFDLIFKGETTSIVRVTGLNGRHQELRCTFILSLPTVFLLLPQKQWRSQSEILSRSYEKTDNAPSFTLDGQLDGPPFHHIPDNTPAFEYDKLVYSKTGLSQAKQHTLRVGVTDSTNQGNYWIGFDYAYVT